MPNGEALKLLGSALQAADVLLEWLMTYAIHSTILIGGLLILTSTTAGRKLVSGHGSWIWRFALVGAVITSSLQALRPAAPLIGTLRLGDTAVRTVVRVEARRVDNAAVHERRTALTAQRAEWREWPNSARPEGGRAVITSAIEIRPVWPLVVLGTWFVIAAMLVGWFVIARERFLRAIRPRLRGNQTLAENTLRYLQREGQVSRPVTLTMSDRLTSPVALGGDEICLPSRATAELDPIRMESILAHELAHLLRRDPTWLTIARLIEAIFFFQPLNIVARRRMQEAAEFASDAWASRRVSRPLDLAHCLARVAEWTIAAPRLPVPAMAERGGAVLVRRVERLTTGRVVPEEVPGRRVRLMAAVTLLGLILFAPRAAVGANRRSDLTLAARIPSQTSVVMVRSVNGVRLDLPPILRQPNGRRW